VIRVSGREPFGGPVMVELGGRTHSLGPELAGSMRITRPERAPR
jgi:Fe2+ transport system protein FeoA